MHGAPDPAQDKRIQDQLSRIKYPILVMSGKGGVGKTTVAVNLAATLAARGFRVGIMDIDIHGPNVPKMLGIEDKSFSGTDGAIEPVEISPTFKAASIALIGYDPDEAIIWRGPMKIGLIKQFLGDVVWGDLDYLIIDTPPGTGDESLTIAQTVSNLAGAVVVTTPQDVSILDSRKSLNFARKLKVPVLGVIENMSGFICPCCGTRTDIFKEGGGKKAADEMQAPFLGAIPIEAGIARAGDAGTPYMIHGGTEVAKVMETVIDGVLHSISRFEAQGAYVKPVIPPGFKPER